MCSNLVVVCAGDASLHTRYLEPHRNYDLCVVYFGGQHGRYLDHSEHYLVAKGTQPQLLDMLFRQMPELLDQYEQFWLPDDDLETTTSDVNCLFDLFRDSGFYIAQPSLEPDSYASFSMLTCKGLGSCETNFVEFMCPLFSRKSLKSSVQFFSESMTGWGVDELWSVRAIEKGEKLGIFDQVRIGHYRPVKSSSWYRDLEIDPHQESRELKLRHGLADRMPQRFHPLVEPPAPNNKVGLPPNAPFILGGQSGSCLRAVAEILLHSKRMYLDLDKSSDYPEVLDSRCMRNTSRHQGMTPGLAEPELIMRVLECAGSTDYGFSTLPTELQKELLLAGAHMQELLELGAKDPSCFNPSTRAFGGTWQRREQWGWKESRSMYYLPLWKALFGRFRFIHIVRDPRSISDDQMEAAAEFFDAMFAQNSAHLQIHPSADSANRERFELCWAKANLGVYQWANREMPHDYLLLRAEDLAGQDEKAKRETSRLLNFVGLDFVDRSRSDTVFRPIGPVRQVQAEPQQALVAEALRTFNYTRGVV